MPSLPGALYTRGDALSTRSSSCAGRCPLYPILLVRGEMPSLPDPLYARGDTRSIRSPSSHDDDDGDDDDDDADDDDDDDDDPCDEDQVYKGL